MRNEGELITGWLDQHGDPEIEKYVEKNLAIVEKVRLALDRKGWKSLDLAKAMDKSPSEVSKWLTGMHNLTLKSIVRMEIALDVVLIDVEPVKEMQYVYLGIIKGGEMQVAISDYEETAYSIAL